jgi:uridine phosphorylase
VLVLADLAELGVRRAVRVGTCVGLEGAFALGDLLVVTEALAEGGSAAALGAATGEAVLPDPDLTARLVEVMGARARPAPVSSFDLHPGEHLPPAGAADMQSAPLLARARSLGVEAAAVLIVAETSGGGELGKEEIERTEKQAGQAASHVLSS